MRLFRTSSLENLAVTMAGVKLGHRVLLAACRDPKLVAALAVKTGLTGRACAVDDSPARTTEAARVAHAEGALIETVTAPLSALPLDDGSFDVVVLRDVLSSVGETDRIGIAQEASRVLRPGGRCLVIETAGGGGLLRVLRGGAPPSAVAGAAVSALQAAQFRGVRMLAQREGLAFVEGVKPAVS